MMKLAMPRALTHNRHEDLKHILSRHNVELSFVPEFSLYLLNKYFLRGKDRSIEKLRYVYVRKSKGRILYLYNRYALNRSPWIMEVESLQRLMPQINLSKRIKKKILTRILSDDQCKSITPWSEYCANQFYNEFDDANIRKKIKVIYPSYPNELDSFSPKKESFTSTHKKKFIFVGRDFVRKGGGLLVDIFKDFQEEASLTIISTNIPQKYVAIAKQLKNITYINGINRKKLFSEMYPSHDFMIMPSLYEAFGLVFLEAMKFGLICIGSEVGAMKEIIEDRQSGFIIKTPEYIKNLNSEPLDCNVKGLYRLFEEKEYLPENVKKKFSIEIKKIIERCIGLEHSKITQMRKCSLELVSTKFSPSKQATSLVQVLDLCREQTSKS